MLKLNFIFNVGNVKSVLCLKVDLLSKPTVFLLIWLILFLHRVMDVDLKFNAIDGDTNRISHNGPYQLDEDGAPVYVFIYLCTVRLHP